MDSIIFSEITKIVGWLFPLLIPPLHIYTLSIFWKKFTYEVDESECTCSCWDTVFKGPYETGLSVYKHWYFNATGSSFKIWFLIVTGVLMLYECIKHLVTLSLEKKLRNSMAILFLSSLFTHYSGWWVYLNYFNDDCYALWTQHLFLMTTEVASSVFVIHLANRENEVVRWKVLTVIGIAILHVIEGGIDYFDYTILYNQDDNSAVMQYVVFMVPDILHIVLSIILLKKKESLRNWKFRKEDFMKIDILYTSLLIVAGHVIYSHL